MAWFLRFLDKLVGNHLGLGCFWWQAPRKPEIKKPCHFQSALLVLWNQQANSPPTNLRFPLFLGGNGPNLVPRGEFKLQGTVQRVATACNVGAAGSLYNYQPRGALLVNFNQRESGWFRAELTRCPSFSVAGGPEVSCSSISGQSARLYRHKRACFLTRRSSLIWIKQGSKQISSVTAYRAFPLRSAFLTRPLVTLK